MVAFGAPISGKNISPLMPVLRDNFWLTLHVLTITASYGAGALAWGLGNIALAHYLFGRYRDPVTSSSTGKEKGRETGRDAGPPTTRLTRRPPAACDTLGTFMYKAIQVTVLLLATGTILGALWADVAWGRFWNWDPKEVWALVSTLVYLGVLHGRRAGWFGNFGLAVASVLGVSSILMSWYGVNLLGSGLHDYATVAGGQWYIIGIVAANWLFAGIASTRYLAETGPPGFQAQESAT